MFLKQTFLSALLSAILLISASATAEHNWSCNPISDGPPGICPDCLELCVRQSGAHALELQVRVDQPQPWFLCSLDAIVHQNGAVLFDGLVDLESPLELR